MKNLDISNTSSLDESLNSFNGQEFTRQLYVSVPVVKGGRNEIEQFSNITSVSSRFSKLKEARAELTNMNKLASELKNTISIKKSEILDLEETISNQIRFSTPTRPPVNIGFFQDKINSINTEITSYADKLNTVLIKIDNLKAFINSSPSDLRVSSTGKSLLGNKPLELIEPNDATSNEATSISIEKNEDGTAPSIKIKSKEGSESTSLIPYKKIIISIGISGALLIGLKYFKVI